MTNNELATLVAEALQTAAEAIFDAVDDDGVQGAKMGTGDTGLTGGIDVLPEVVAPVVTTEAEQETDKTTVDAVIVPTDKASYEIRLAEALRILKGGK